MKLPITHAQAYDLLKQGTPVYGIVDRSDSVPEEEYDTVAFQPNGKDDQTELRNLARFHWGYSCSGWKPRPQLGFALDVDTAIAFCAQLNRAGQ